MGNSLCRRWVVLFCVPLMLVACSAAHADAQDQTGMARQLQPLLACLSGQNKSYQWTAELDVPIDGQVQRIDAHFARFSDDAFDLDLIHQDYALLIRRRADQTAMVLPRHNTVFLAGGETDPNDHLRPAAIMERLISPLSKAATVMQVISNSDASAVALILQGLTDITFDPVADVWKLREQATIRFSSDGTTIDVAVDEAKLRMEIKPIDKQPEEIRYKASEPDRSADDAVMKVVELPRAELEQQLVRGVRRASEILAPASYLTSPPETSKRVENGELRWIDGQRVALLHGTPEQIGKAHGELLSSEAMRCIDSVLYTFGTVQTIRTGRWFRHDLADAYARLEKHLPERHKSETRAMAASLQLDPQLVETLNVFPELFHCSGFALFGRATIDGKMYHGRVLDYMTTIGLQDAATTFIIAPQGRHAFANVGYAGFIGSVSGMNDQGVSLGEMGGRGEGQWDGVPMATLMRRALEECETIDDVIALWKDSPRTCEYYYVFADGKTNRAVGVAATPDSIEFIQPGQAHELLGHGIDDAVVLSAGSRLEMLRARVQEKYGSIDVEAAKWLMSRPVAMESNLHNVLFVPADGVLYVANASHDEPAAQRPYVRLDLFDLLKSMPAATDKQVVQRHPTAEASAGSVSPDASALTDGATFAARDSLNPGEDPSPDARECLQGLVWEPTTFEVRCQTPQDSRGDWIIQFPSPVPSGDAANDVVTMEWYMARDEADQPIKAPAVVVVHESGSSMAVGRMIASAMPEYGLHALMIQLPYYGQRRADHSKPRGEQLFSVLRQAIADVRRARDAVATLPLIDSQNISVQGTSLGGFVTATAAGLDQGFDHVFIMLAGGDLFDVIEKGEKDTARMRNDLAEQGLTGAKLRALTNKIEPTRLAHRMRPSTTWLYSAQFDRVVPPANSKLLASAAGLDGSHHIQMLANHYSGIVFVPFILKQMQQQIFAVDP